MKKSNNYQAKNLVELDKIVRRKLQTSVEIKLTAGTATSHTLKPTTYRFLFLDAIETPSSRLLFTFSDKEWEPNDFENQIELMAANLREEGYDVKFRRITPELTREHPTYDISRRADIEPFQRLSCGRQIE